MKHLTIEDIDKAIETGKKVNISPDYPNPKKNIPKLSKLVQPFVLLKKEKVGGCWNISISDSENMPGNIYVNDHGRGISSGHLPFVWAGDVGAASGPLALEPRNNDGRETCYWCSVKTEKRGGGMYDVCPKCGR